MKKILLIILASAMLLSQAAFAESATNRAIFLCYDESGKLVYSKLLKSDTGVYDCGELPLKAENTTKKIYYVDTQELKLWEDEAAPAPAESPVPTATPTAAAQETPVPTATAKPTTPPASEPSADSPYEKAVDMIYAPAIITKDVAVADNGGEKVYLLEAFFQGKEVSISVEEDLKISSAPEAYSYVAGETAGSLKKGDVICMSANITGTRVKTIDLLIRPTQEDIVTSDTDYGANFEKLFTSGGTVAGQWQYVRYGTHPDKSRYQYAFGVVAEMSNNSLTLLNKSTDPDDAIDIDVSPKAYVYSCDVSSREYEFDLGGAHGITTSLPKSVLKEDEIVLNDDYSYNYAFVRIVDDVATDIVLFNNYNY